MKITVFDINKDFIDAFDAYLKSDPDLPEGVSIKTTATSFYDKEADAIVSPANSFGEMTGGIDLAYVRFFGQQIQDDVKAITKYFPHSEILVGLSFSIPTYNDKIRHLIVSPTMAFPSRILDIRDVYLATRAAFDEAFFEGFNSVLIPGMGTATGGVDYRDAAMCMIAGIRSAHKEFNGRF